MSDLTQFEGHTPGPWEPKRSEDFGTCVIQQGGLIVANLPNTKAEHIGFHVACNGRGRDARLIAAAPELLQEVQQLRAEVERLRKERDEARAENEKLRARVEVLESQRKSISETCHCLRNELDAAIDDDDDPPPVKTEPVAKGRIMQTRNGEKKINPLLLTNVRIAFLNGGIPEYRAEPVPDGDMSDARLAATRRVIAIAPTLYARVAVVVEMLEEARQSGDEANPYELLTDIEQRLTKALSQ